MKKSIAIALAITAITANAFTIEGFKGDVKGCEKLVNGSYNSSIYYTCANNIALTFRIDNGKPNILIVEDVNSDGETQYMECSTTGDTEDYGYCYTTVTDENSIVLEERSLSKPSKTIAQRIMNAYKLAKKSK